MATAVRFSPATSRERRPQIRGGRARAMTGLTRRWRRKAESTDEANKIASIFDGGGRKDGKEIGQNEKENKVIHIVGNGEISAVSKDFS
jgi:hypothetical protein